MIDLEFTPATTQKASQDIVNQIQASILSGKLKPGDRLPAERELTTIFARSRPTIREALRVLEKDGLLSVVGGSSGSIICEPSAAQLEQPLHMMLAMKTITPEELYEARFMAELSLVQWAADRHTDEDLAEMHRILALEQESFDNLERFVQLDRDFHETIAKAGQNCVAEVLIRVLRQPMLDTIASSFMRLSKKQLRSEQMQLIETHMNITRAITANDPLGAKREMKLHVEQFRRINNNC